MIEPTIAEFQALIPEFSEYADTVAGAAQINAFFEFANELIDETKWGETKGKKGVIFLTAHFLKEVGNTTSSNSTGTSGPVTSEKVGDLSKGYASTSATGGSFQENLLSSTRYGQMFLLLKRTIATTPLVV